MAGKKKKGKAFRKIFEGNKLDVWRAYIAAGGRVGEVAAQFQITPEEVNEIIEEVEDFFHAPLNDTSKILNQISILNEAASRAEFMLYEVIQYQYNRWKSTGEDPPEELVSSLEKWHSLLLDRIKVHLRLLHDIRKEIETTQDAENEQRYLEQLISDTEDDDDIEEANVK